MILQLFLVAIISKHLIIELLRGDKVADAEKCAADDRFEQPDGRTQLILISTRIDEPYAVGHCIDDIARLINHFILKGDYLIEPRTHDIAEIEHAHQDNGGCDTGQSDV